MLRFRDGFYADVRTEDRSRTIISYKGGVLEEIKNRMERRAFLRVYDGRLWYYAAVTDLDRLQETLDGVNSRIAEINTRLAGLDGEVIRSRLRDTYV